MHFFNEHVNDLFKIKRIIHRVSCSYTPQQNGRVECEYKHLLKVTSSSYTPQHNGRVEREHKHLLKVVSSLKLQSVIHVYFCRPCVLFI